MRLDWKYATAPRPARITPIVTPREQRTWSIPSISRKPTVETAFTAMYTVSPKLHRPRPSA